MMGARLRVCTDNVTVQATKLAVVIGLLTSCTPPQLLLAGSQLGPDRYPATTFRWNIGCALRHWGSYSNKATVDDTLPTGTIAAAFCDDQGQPIVGVTVILADLADHGSSSISELSSRNGEVQFMGLSPGRYVLSAEYGDTVTNTTLNMAASKSLRLALTLPTTNDDVANVGPRHSCCQPQRIVAGQIQDATFSFMVRSHVEPGVVEGQPLVANLQSIDSVLQPLSFQIFDQHMVWAGRYDGFTVRMTNISDTDLVVTAREGTVAIVQQAQDRYGRWRDVEYLPWYVCGNSYAQWTLRAGTAREFIAPRYRGRFHTLLRFVFRDDSVHYAASAKQPPTIMYSPTFEGSLNESQFTWRKRHRAEHDRYRDID
jgi:hypothetical protein